MAANKAGPARSKRPVRHVPFRERLRSGDVVVLVEQIRSAEHATARQRGAIRSLGLGRIGKSNPQPDAGTTWGAVHQVAHLVHAEKVVWTPSDVRRGDVELRRQQAGRRGASVVTTPYVIGPGAGLRIDVEAEWSVYVERYESGGSVTWPTRQTPGRLGRLANSVLRWSSDDTTTEVFARNADPTFIALEDLGQLAGAALEHVDVVRIDSSDESTSLVWQRDLNDRHRFEASFIAPKLDAKLLGQLMERSAVKPISFAGARTATRAIVAIESLKLPR